MHFDQRPAGVAPDLIVLHGISLPPAQFGGGWIERLFCGSLPAQAHPYFAGVAQARVSAHLLLARDGQVSQFVPFGARAWHAGVSSYQGRAACNDFSIGIELEGLEGQAFEDAQYAALVRLLDALALRYPIECVVGHEHVAPIRKLDPGAGFDWRRLAAALGWPAARFAPGVVCDR